MLFRVRFVRRCLLILIKFSHDLVLNLFAGGAGDHSHDLLWHEVRAGETVVCMGCGQHFVLQKVENEKWDDGYSRYDGKFGQPPVIHDTYHI